MTKIIKYFFLPLFILGTLAYLALAWHLSNLVLTTRPSNLALTKTRIAAHWKTTYEAIMAKFPAPQEFSISTHDNLTLKGWHIQRPDTADCAAILSHGFTATKEGILKYADIYWNCGCDLVVYDHRGHGESDDAYPTGGVLEKEDLIRITQWFKQESGFEGEQIAWVGSSWGAATALQAGAMNEEIAFIVADSPFQDWYAAVFERAIRMYGDNITWIAPGVMSMVSYRTGIDFETASALKAAPQIKVPVLLIHSQTDEQTGSSQSVNIAAALAPDQSVFHHTDWGAGHTLDVIERPEDYANLVYDFIEKFNLDFGTCR